jgi:uncharacterized membrane-anchored protein
VASAVCAQVHGIQQQQRCHCGNQGESAAMSAATIILFVVAIVMMVQLIAWIMNGVRINTYNNKIANHNQAHKER